ncbi:MAG: glycosyltransferase family 1 protein [Polyangiaceae bacterium]
MKLLVDLTSLDTPSRSRGMGRYVRELAAGLAGLPKGQLGGIELVGLTHLDLDGSYRTTDDLASFQGSATIATPSPRDYYHWAYARRFALWRAVRSMGANAVHLPDPHATPLFMPLTSCRRIVTLHDLIPVRWPERYMGTKDGGPVIGTAIERRRYRSADLVIAISNSTRDDAQNLLGVDPNKMVRVYHGIDLAKWKVERGARAGAIVEKRGLAGRRFLLYVGGYDWHKNVEGMMSAVAKARREFPDLVLVWAGRLSDERQALIRDIARQASLADEALQLVGFVPDDELVALYGAAIAHVLVSRYEGFGLTLIEAMASGCPVVASTGGSLAELAADAAIVTDPDDHDAIAAGIVRLCRDPDFRAKLIDRGIRRAAEFPLSAHAKTMAETYRAFLERG